MIYLDHNATTPVAPEVREAMLPYLEREFGNPSSAHAYGASAKAEPSTVLTAMGLDEARAVGAVRLSIGHDNTAAEIDAAAWTS